MGWRDLTKIQDVCSESMLELGFNPISEEQYQEMQRTDDLLDDSDVDHLMVDKKIVPGLS